MTRINKISCSSPLLSITLFIPITSFLCVFKHPPTQHHSYVIILYTYWKSFHMLRNSHLNKKSCKKEVTLLMRQIYSAKLLFESISSPSSMPDKIFEERIILVRAKNHCKVKDIIQKTFQKKPLIMLKADKRP